MSYLDVLGYAVLTSLAVAVVAAVIRFLIWLFYEA